MTGEYQDHLTISKDEEEGNLLVGKEVVDNQFLHSSSFPGCADPDCPDDLQSGNNKH